MDFYGECWLKGILECGSQVLGGAVVTAYALVAGPDRSCQHCQHCQHCRRSLMERQGFRPSRRIREMLADARRLAGELACHLLGTEGGRGNGRRSAEFKGDLKTGHRTCCEVEPTPGDLSFQAAAEAQLQCCRRLLLVVPVGSPKGDRSSADRPRWRRESYAVDRRVLDCDGILARVQSQRVSRLAGKQVADFGPNASGRLGSQAQSARVACSRHPIALWPSFGDVA